MELPYSDELEIKYLSRLFDNTSESYKLFWFQAIVNKILEGKDTLTYDELINEMIVDSWYMVTEYHLNLGPKDTLESLVNYLYQMTGMKSCEKKDKIKSYLDSCIDKEVYIRKKQLTKNVPYRLQAPFMENLKGTEWNVSEKNLISKINRENRLMYYFETANGMNTTIHIEPEWCLYIHKNQEIIKGWLQYKFIVYLQKRNPSVPGIADKICPPSERKLDKVKKYWKLLLSIEPMREIYTNEELDANEISIDHFVPWSFVAHDELWNLHPTTKSINSSKSNNLPDWNKYFPELAKLEYEAYKIIWTYDTVHNEFNKCAKEHLNNTDIRRKLYRKDLDIIQFSNALEETVQPVYMSAKDCGFKSWER